MNQGSKYSLIVMVAIVSMPCRVVPPSRSGSPDVFSRGSSFAASGAANPLTFSDHGRPF